MLISHKFTPKFLNHVSKLFWNLKVTYFSMYQNIKDGEKEHANLYMNCSERIDK